MNAGQVIFEGKTKKGTPIVVRYPKEGDAALMMDYINILSEEQTFIRFQGEKLSLEEEEEYLKDLLKKIEEKRAITLLVFSEGNLVANSGIEMKDKIESHQGIFGITVAKDFRGEGVGKTLTELVLKEAEKNLPALRIVTLQVFKNNFLAWEMYKKLGFQEYGRLPKGILHKDKYVDDIHLYKVVGKVL